MQGIEYWLSIRIGRLNFCFVFFLFTLNKKLNFLDFSSLTIHFLIISIIP